MKQSASNIDAINIDQFSQNRDRQALTNRIERRWQRNGDKVIFSVKDNGYGIKADQLNRLTERFYRIDKSRSRDTGGSGLGLAIVKHVLLHHKAELVITSIWGQGSEFAIYFEEGLAC